jgi:hypothetical protein
MTLETSPTTAALDDALVKAQSQIKNASKDSVNPHFKSKYADLASIWEACKEALAKNNIAVTQWPVASEDQKLHLITRISHKGEFMQGRIAIPMDKQNAHGVGSAITYAKRYALAAALGVADEDDDGNAASKKVRPHADFVAEAQKDGLISGDPDKSQYEVDKQKKAIAAGWKVTNTTTKGQISQVVDYLNMAPSAIAVNTILKANADVIAAAPTRDDIVASADDLLRFFNEQATGAAGSPV